jgi:hypothetical protein
MFHMIEPIIWLMESYGKNIYDLYALWMVE